MDTLILVIVVVGTLSVISSGIWVAIALANAISADSRGAASLPEKNKIPKIKMQN